MPDAAISAYEATLANSEFRNTIIDESENSATAYYLPNTGNPCNTIDSKVTGFSSPFIIENPDCNVYNPVRYVQDDFSVSRSTYITNLTPDMPMGFYTLDASSNSTLQATLPKDPAGSSTWLVTIDNSEEKKGTSSQQRMITVQNIKSKNVYAGSWSIKTNKLTSWQKTKSFNEANNKTDVSMKSEARGRLGFGTAAAQSADAFMPASDGKLKPTGTTTFTSTSGWSTSDYTSVMEPGKLIENTIYLVKSTYNKRGLDVIVQSWLVPVSTTYPNSGIPSDLIGNTSVYNATLGRYIKLRQKPGPVPNTTYGLEAAFSKADMIANDATLTISVTPLF